MVHVPYRGGAPAFTDLLAGQVQVLFAATVASIAYIRTGRLRALAVTTTTRSDALPDLPTVGKFVPGYEAAPSPASAHRGTPPPKSSKAQQGDQCRSCRSQAEGAVCRRRGDVLSRSSADFGKLIAEETEKWS